jgi:DNA-directed RNA polymerase specialized sigma24 family protein
MNKVRKQTPMKRLRELKYSRAWLESEQERLARLRSALNGSRDQQLNPAGVTLPPRPGDRIGAQLAAIEEQEARIQHSWVLLEASVRAAEYLIKDLPEAQQEIMRLRYLEGKTWAQVVKEAGCTRHQALCRHTRAISHLK